MRKCIIHAGTHKTGTTSIQNALSICLRKNTRCNFIYPLIGDQVAHHSIAFSMFDATRMSAYGGASVEDLVRMMRESSADVILSSEEFIHAIHYAPENFQAFIEYIRPMFSTIVIIVYLRSQADFLQSNYFERLKTGLSLDFQSYVFARLNANFTEFPLDYCVLTDELLKIKSAQIVVRDYICKDSVHDFFDFCGIDVDRTLLLERQNDRHNLSRSIKQFYTNIYREHANPSVDDIVNKIHLLSRDKKPCLSNMCKNAIVNRFIEGNRRVSEAFNLSGLNSTHNANEHPVNRAFLKEPSFFDSVDSDLQSFYIDTIFSANFAALMHVFAEAISSKSTPIWRRWSKS